MAGELYSTYDQVGIKEDVSDVISTVTPSDTPFLSSLSKEGCDNTYVEWQEDSLRAAADNKKVEGADATIVARTATTMLSNRTQILSDAFQISGTNERVKKYGRKSEIAYQTVKAGKQLKLDLEYALVTIDNAAVAGDENTAREMASVYPLIHADTTITADAGAGAADALDENYVLDAMEALYGEGGDGKVLMIKPSDARIVAAFAAASGRNREIQQDKRLVNVVDVYVSPYGETKVVLNRHLIATAALLYNPENWKLLVLRDWFREKLAKTGDSEKFQIVGEFSLKHKNQRASGLIENLT